MSPNRARQFVTELAMVMGVELPVRRVDYYVEALAPSDDRLAQAAFSRLVTHAKRFPTVAEVLDAFRLEAEEAYGTREVRRLEPSSESQAKDAEAMRRWLAFEPVHYHADLYAGYVDALMECRVGRRSWDELERLRQTLIAQARARGRAGPPATAPQPTSSAAVVGIEASVPRGDRS